eukprot:4898692-Karenia_brevis.AAC.1
MVCDRKAPDSAQNMKLPLSMNSVIPFLLQKATVVDCPRAEPFYVQFETDIPDFLRHYMIHKWNVVLQE